MVLPNDWPAQSIYSMTGPDYSVDRATQLNLYKLYEKRTYVTGTIDHLFKTLMEKWSFMCKIYS